MARAVGEGGTLVLDAEGLSKAASNDRAMRIRLAAAYKRDARVVLSAITIAEVLRHPARDANVNRALKKLAVIDVDTDIARDAGVLLGKGAMTGTPGNPTVDAVVAATAIRQDEPVIVLTSDPGDLTRLLDDTPVTVIHV
ncbi:type II toxin-antitoxin system VapC family toxin [Nocardioides sp.]|uniref:type II toxin-antitoxin system VapC family toxin n=1 Tax=Nocardioides sp. TaxID=35761 RepID=UPI002C3E418C|nr:PIN domain-containing protein [Nocardioides sp.]HXH78674.1 PIN domain-containing protein [Nocardioides sp.]